MENKKIHILLVEDDEVDVMNVQRAFKKNNIVNPLYMAANGLEAGYIAPRRKNRACNASSPQVGFAGLEYAENERH
jgi:hypothetical protein